MSAMTAEQLRAALTVPATTPPGMPGMPGGPPAATAPRVMGRCRDPHCAEPLDPVLCGPDGTGVHVLCADPLAMPAGPPCLDPWCASTRNPCGHTPDAHMLHHGAQAIVSGDIARSRTGAVQPTHELPAATTPTTGATSAVTPFTPLPGPHPFKAELTQMIRWYEANSPRTLQEAIGPSEIGAACIRRLAYRTRGVPSCNTVADPWFAIIGTAVHDWLAFAVDTYQTTILGRTGSNRRYLIEQRVTLPLPGGDVVGSTDVFDRDEHRVIDYKIVGGGSLKKYQDNGPPPEYDAQVDLYGYGWELAGYPVKEVCIAFLPRSNYLDRAHIWARPYNRNNALSALARLQSIRQLAAALPLPLIPATPDPAGCTWCNHYRPGPPTDATGCSGPAPTPST